MAKFVNDAVMDAALTKYNTATRETVTSAQPANFAGIAAVTLAQKTGLTSGSFTVADGTTSGRKSTVAAASAVSITASGTATHVCLDDGTTLLAVTTCTSQALVSGGTVDIPAFAYEIADAV
jgi:hypothetical protein